ncbi:MAG: hypothetical protein IPL84_09280 [Chitinophagaceae bacterium]|nr:hypothetical protein [Chitinophagaceae bacterium]
MKKGISVLLFMVTLFTNAKAKGIADTVYAYYDAARNKYVLKGKELEYIPVQKKESSSGMYSGGTYESRELNKKEREKLELLFNAALADTLAQADKNIKPNAAIEISIDSRKISFILIATLAINKSINNYLKQVIKNLEK